MRKIKQFLGMGQSPIIKEEKQKVIVEKQSQKKGVTRNKIVMFGDANAGKTCFYAIWQGKPFDHTCNPTVGIDFMAKNIDQNNRKRRLNIWDTIGQHKQQFWHMISQYLKGSDGFIFVYDITRRSSFVSVKQYWHSRIIMQGYQNVPKILIGTKLDLEQHRQISIETGMQLAKSLGMEFIQVSAIRGQNLEKALIMLVDKIALNQAVNLSQVKPIKRQEMQVKKQDKNQQLWLKDEQSFKVILVGPAASGKSYLWGFWKQGHYPFSPEVWDTSSMAYLFKNVSIEQKKIVLEIWDTYGASIYAPILTNYFPYSKGLIFVYDITSKESFDTLKHQWYPLAIQNAPLNTPQILIGHKSDLQHSRQVTLDEAIQFAESFGMLYIETSVYNQSNVEEALIMLGKKIYQQFYKDQQSQNQKRQKKDLFKLSNQKDKNLSNKNINKNKNEDSKLRIDQKKHKKPKHQLIQKNFEEKDKKISELENKLKMQKQKALKSQQEYEQMKRELKENIKKYKEEEEQKKKHEPPKDKDFYDILSQNQVSDITIQILKSEEIKSFKELKYFKDEDLKKLGIKLGQIARIRQIS